MKTVLELENENSKRRREELSIELNDDGSVLISAVVDENTEHGWKDPGLIEVTDYTLSKEQVASVIEFLTKSLEK